MNERVNISLPESDVCDLSQLWLPFLSSEICCDSVNSCNNRFNHWDACLMIAVQGAIKLSRLYLFIYFYTKQATLKGCIN